MNIVLFNKLIMKIIMKRNVFSLIVVLMATVSFNKNFVVSNPTAIKMSSEDIANPRYVEIKKRDLKVENAKGIQLLKKRLSSSAR